MARRDSRLDIALRRWWARALVAALVAVGVVLAWLWAFEFFGEELDMDFVAWPVGILVAIGGYLLIGLVYRKFGPRAAPMHLSEGALAKKLEGRLDRLSDLTHTVHPLGDPWPRAVIGPTGVYLVEPRSVAGHVGYLEGEILLDGEPAGPELLGEVRRLLPTVEQLLHQRAQLPLPVTGVIAVDDATIVPGPLQAGHLPIRVVPLNQFPEAVDFGETHPHTVVREAAAAIIRWRPAKGRRR